MPQFIQGESSNLNSNDKRVTITHMDDKVFLDVAIFRAPLKMRTEFDSTGLPLYVGYAVPGSAEADAVWQIFKNTISGRKVTGSNFANGSAAFKRQWSKRTTYSFA